MKKRTIAIVVAGAMVLGNVHQVMAESFEGREDEMNAKCSAYDTNTLNECKRYKAYLEEKSNNLDSQISDIKNQVSSMQGDVDKIKAAVVENTKTLQSYDGQINTIQGNINKIETNISAMNAEIEAKQNESKDRDDLMKKRMLEIQAYVGSNSYIDFIMGSSDFSDLLRRSEIIGELNGYENDQISSLAKEKKAILEQIKIVEEQKDFLEVQKQDISDKRKVAEALYESNQQLVVAYQSQQADLNARQIAAEMESDAVKASLPSISTTIPPNFGGGSTPSTPDDGDSGGGGSSGGDTSGLSTYLQVPMNRSSWNYYFGTWAYPGGGVHLGMDLSTGYTTRIPVSAPASGVVLTTYSGCPEYGGLGNKCGLAWAGNAVVLAVQLANGESYVFGFYHLYTPSVTPGQIVSQGQQIGLSGSSGNSEGPHCHVEMIYMGNRSLQEVINIWNANKDVSFGLGWTNSNACGSAPCRLRPENFFL